MDLRGAIYARMVSDSALAALVTSYEGSPAIFTSDRAPAAAQLPYIVSPPSVADEPDDSKTDRGRKPTRDIVCFAPHFETDTVEAMAERVLELFHGYRLPLDDGWYATRARASGPVGMSSDDYDGRVITIRWDIAKGTP